MAKRPYHKALLLSLMGMVLAVQGMAQVVADAGADVTICAGGPVTLGGAAASGGHAPYMYSWVPATGLSDASVLHPVCTATSSQNYTLTVTDIDGNTATDQVMVNVKPMPSINLDCTNASTSVYGGVLTFSLCDQGLSAYDFDFADASTAMPGATYSIDWGNGQTENFSAPGWTSSQHFPIGLTSGTYTITQPAPNGCSRTIPFNVFVGEVPLGGLSVVSNSSICTGGSISFEWNNFGTNPPGTLYIVDYGDGQVDTLVQPPASTFSHTYNTSSCTAGGEFSIAWRITNPCDTRTGVIGQIRVSGMPVAQMNVPNDTVCVNTTVNVTDASQGAQAPACTNPKHVWSINPATGWSAGGNMGSMNGQPANPGVWTNGAAVLPITFTAPGTYTVTSVVGNACGLDTLHQTICVEAPPTPAFSLSTTAGCSPLAVGTTNTTTDPASCSTRYNWQAVVNNAYCGSNAAAAFTGGTGAASFAPQFTLTGAGIYEITMQAINSCGTFPVSQTVDVGAPPQVMMDPLSSICAGQVATPTATFTPCGTPISSYSWNFSNGIPGNSSAQDPGVIAFPSAGSFSITVSAGSACGSGTDNTVLTVNPLPPAPQVNGAITLCVGEDLQLSATPIPGATFQWTGPGGFTSNLPSPIIHDVTLAEQGVYSVSASIGGCNGPTSTINVTVNPAPVISLSPLAPTVCEGGAVTLTASGGSNYQWVMDGVNIGTGSPFTFTPDHTGTVVLHGNANGCTGSTSTLVTVYPIPDVDAGPDKVFCEGAQPQMIFPFTPLGTWSGSPYVTPDGSFTPAAQGTYELVYTVVSPEGCLGTDTVEVQVTAPPPPAVAGPDVTMCLNDPPVQYNGSPAGGYWNGDISISGLFTPTTPGTFTITYSIGSGSCFTTDDATVTVLPLPVLDPGADMSVCIDAAVFPLGAVPPGGTWSGNGVSGSDFGPQAAGPGQHVLTYAYTDLNGCSNTADRTITVDPLPIVSAGNDTTFCDQPVPQVLDGYGPLGGTWSGAHVTSSGVFTPNGPGSFPLTYTYTDANGCSASDQMTVSVITINNPAMAGNDTAVCINSGLLQLGDAPLGGTWSGPHVDASGAFDPVQEGTFLLTYSVGGGSCITQDQLQVTVHALPQPVITAMPDVCVDAADQTFSALPAGGTWAGTGITDPNAGTFSPAATGAGTFAITYALTDANGCSNSVTGDVTVHDLPVAAFSNDPVACSGTPFQFTDESTGTDAWTWDFGDGGSAGTQSPDHTFPAPGTYPVTLTAVNTAGCTNITVQDVTVWEGPTVAFTTDVLEGCGPLAVQLDNQSFGDGISYAWDLGDGNTSADPQPGTVTFAASPYADTTYVITLTGSNTCGSVDATRTITVHPAPTAIFGPDFNSGCSPWPVTFSNVTIGSADSYWWDFGDGTTSTTLDSLVQHTYYAGATDSIYTVTLVATNACGTDTAHYTITALPNTITAFFNTDTTSGCAPLTVNFTQYSIGVHNWHWDLGDGNVSTDADVTHTYSLAGVYTATLFGDNGCSFDTVSVDITVHATPVADFTVAPGLFCEGTPIQFTNNTPAPAGLTWDFGDGSTSTLSAPQHGYANAGTYNVTLSVASTTTPCPATATQTVHVLATPVAAIAGSPLSGCTPLQVQFQGGGTNTDFQQWDFGDGNTSGATNPAHTFAAAGNFQVQLIAENLNGCTDTATVDIVAFPLPSASFTLAEDQHCGVPAAVQLTNTSSGAVDYAWDLGNGSTSGLNDPVATYTQTGTYTITLTASNQYGCTAQDQGVYTVHPMPIAAFGAEPMPACAGYPVSFNNYSVDAFSYVWSFGDGTGSDAEAPAHAYGEGVYTVSLVATGAGGCADATVVPAAVVVNPRPVAAFSYEPMQSTSYALQFFNHSQGAVRWLWDFGDGDTSSVFQPMHLFPAGPGDLYPFCLVAVNEYDCPDTLCQRVLAVNDPNVFAPNAFTPDHDGLNEDFLPVLNGFDNWRYELLIFDRWGEVIHESRDRHRAWDGTSRGKPVKSDVYVWKVILNRGGDERVYYGHVTVICGTE
ncbi:MAG TPA: PKD domain-containing protein [Flavobacteriales bacterium]|nr:PKD domain-containing protein [Flavobacteriales bacterium]